MVTGKIKYKEIAGRIKVVPHVVGEICQYHQFWWCK